VRFFATVVAGAGTQFCPATVEAFERLAQAELVPGAEE
jgi:hypothetical protein